MADTLKFGPEWLRQLSGGNSVSTPPPSPAPGFGKYKLAEYRYGREEMLALFTPSQKMPEELEEFSAIVTEKGQEPLALLPLTEEEQRITSQSVNSQAVLRMMGRGAPPLRGRGGGFERGRGRGRGRGDGFMQRGLSYDEGEGGGFGRPRGPRQEGWEEIGQGQKRFDRPFPSRFDDTGNPPNAKIYQRSLSNENWRDREEDDDDGDWRKAGGSKWNTHTRGSWRDGRGERGFEYDRNPNIQKGFSRQYQRSRSSESWEEEEMPEWSTDGDLEELGTFDSSGAFVSKDFKPPSKVKKPPGEGGQDETEGEEKKASNSPEPTKDTQKQQKEKPPEKNNEEEKDINENNMKKVDSRDSLKNSETHRQSPQNSEPIPSSPRPVPTKEKEKDKEKPKSKVVPKEADKSKSPQTVNETKAKSVIETPATKQLADHKVPVKTAADKTEKNTENSAKQKESKVPVSSNSAAVSSKEKKLKSEAEALDQLQETVETMVAGMTVEEDDLKEEEVVVPPTPTAGALPQEHENYNKWFYRDPQGDLQGPFTSKEMAEWFSAGYFTMTLQVRRGCDEVFSPLGDLIKRWGRVPFLPGQSPPPAMNKPQPSREATQQQLQQRRDQEQLQALQNFLFQQQLAQQQQLIRQLQLQQIQQMVATLQENEEVKSLPLIQQQQLAMQVLLKHPQQLVMNQQPAALQKLSPRSPEPESAANPSTSQPSFPTSFNQEPGSIWDIEPPKSEPDSELQARRQKEQEEKEEHERRLKQKEEELKKRFEEMEREKQEVERKKQELQRREEEEKKKQEELQRKREEEERRRQLEEEKKKKEEEKRRREEEIRRQQEIERQQEIKRQQELQKQQEAQRLKELKEQEEIEKQKQLEMQRRQELQRQQEIQQQQENLRKQQQQEALQKLQQEQLANMQLPAHVSWGSNQANMPAQGQKSLLEIQQQEERERKEMEKIQRQQAEIQRQQLLALQQEQQQQKSWSNSFIKPQASPTKSLLEIQDEQARQLERERQKREENHQQAVKNMSIGTASVWNSAPTMSNWANDGAWGALKQSAQMNKSNNSSNSLGFWDDAIISTSAAPPPSKKQSNKQGKQGAEFPALSGGPGNKAKQASQTKQKLSKSRKEEVAAERLFQTTKLGDDFTEWCQRQLRNMNTSVDIPTFIAFLQEVESPYEVHDYVRSYLGESKSATEFAKSFLEKRSQYKNKGRPVEEDSIWGPAPAITPRELRQPLTEENQKGKGGKKKKNRMMKLDSSILGFTVHAAPDRIVGEIDSEVSGGTPR